MGNCCSDYEEVADGGAAKTKERRTRTYNLRTPAEQPLRITKESWVSLKFVATADKERTVDVEFFTDEVEKERFQQSLVKLGSRHHSNHQLSRRNWKTASDLTLEAKLPKGNYFICAVSSSKLSDKGVAIKLSVTTNET
eukprot:TRINITY_DN9148_c0_g1_i1.p1 TRINITY_DN9148_c0_g1~~TRINITY_DN9148_c0_g1_i1.p1  ORF type:complete len:139 (+),score=44.02 TRINITY_DN9148_c0_g1_i1:65-481(+)